LHHLRRACDERLDCVDFLCGDFAWKPLFHLRPRPLFLYGPQPVTAPLSTHARHEIKAC
jgi:hypothetical protein